MSGLDPDLPAPVDVLTLGESMVLFWPADGGTLDDASVYRRSCAGAEGNLCVALSRLGHTARWISRLGDDPFGRSIRRTLEAEGVDVRAPIDSTVPTAVFFKERALTGPRRVYYYRRGSAASRMSPDDIDPALVCAARIVHLTGITPALSGTCAAAVRHTVDLARSSGVPVSFDPNVRMQLWRDEDECRSVLLPMIRAADIILLGHEDAEVLFPDLTEVEIPDAVAAMGPRTVVLKRGDRGAVGLRDGEHAGVDACRVQVVDTVGAGDGFDAGFLAGTLRGMGLRECVELGARVGAAAVAEEGDWEGYPSAEDMGLERQFMQEYPDKEGG